jgi:hypothetical protein
MKHVVAAWKYREPHSICYSTEGNQESPVLRWQVSGSSGCCLLVRSPAYKQKRVVRLEFKEFFVWGFYEMLSTHAEVDSNLKIFYRPFL